MKPTAPLARAGGGETRFGTYLLAKPFTDIETAVPWVFFSIHTVVLLASLYFAYVSPA